jgi:flagellar biosynthesis/type III secretory pathway M-ring protein FliF/YscJ
MKNMKKDQLHSLEKIEKVEVSPFLFTRIQAKVQEQFFDKLSTKQTVVYLTGIALIVALNVMILGAKSSDKNENLVSEMNLAPTNQLYP